MNCLERRSSALVSESRTAPEILPLRRQMGVCQMGVCNDCGMEVQAQQESGSKLRWRASRKPQLFQEPLRGSGIDMGAKILLQVRDQLQERPSAAGF